jgi:thymidylate synthase
MTTFDVIYRKLVGDILTSGIEELNERTGHETKILTGQHFTLRPKDFPILTLRKIPVKLFVAEQVWYLQGDKQLDFFQKYSKIWDDFKEEDNTVESGYGYRWRKFFKRDQVAGLIEMLQKEPSSRQGVVITWDPNTDGLASPKKKNTPCVPMWVANIVGGELNFHIVFRSQDVMLGLPHDCAGFALLQHILAQKLGVPVGFLHYSISHAHIYDNHYEQARELVSRSNDHGEFELKLPDQTYERAMLEDETIVDEICDHIKEHYNPLASLGKMQIAL